MKTIFHVISSTFMMLLNVMGTLHPVTAHHSLQRDVHLELNVKHTLCDSHCVRCFHMHYLILSLWVPSEVGIIIFILQ